jgi:hypothetical protein
MDVCHVPKLGGHNLLSLGKLADEGMAVTKTAERIIVYDKDFKKVLVGSKEPHSLWIPRLKGFIALKSYKTKVDALTWPKRLDHASNGKLQLMRRRGSKRNRTSKNRRFRVPRMCTRENDQTPM